MTRRLGLLLTVSVVLVASIFLIGCHDKNAAAQLRVEDLEYQLLPGGARIVSGTVHNDGDVPIRAAQVQISLFDDKNRRVDAMYAVVRDLLPGESVSFREPVQSDLEINGARVKSVLLMD